MLWLDKFYNLKYGLILFKVNHTQLRSIKVATANYSGITNSPFEFYSENVTELTRLNEIFKELFSQIPLLTTDKVDVERILMNNTNYNKLNDKPGGGKSLDDKVEFDWQINNI